MKKIVKPIPLTVIAVFLMISPFCNIYEYLFFGKTTHWLLVRHPFGVQSLVGLAMILAPLLSGIGIFLIRPWGWFLYLAFSFFTVGFGLYRIFSVQSLFAYLISLMNMAIVATSIYVISKNVRTPYLSNEFRGWRIHKRVPLALPVSLLFYPQDKTIETRTTDLSELGTLIELPADAITAELGGKVFLKLSLGDIPDMTVQCRIMQMRETEEGSVLLGLKFTRITRANRRAVASFIDAYSPRYSASIPARIDAGEDGPISGVTLNISSNGCYIAAEGFSLQGGEPVTGSLFIDGEGGKPVTFRGAITWANPFGDFGKPRGLGVHLQRITNRRLAFYRYLYLKARRSEVVR